LIAPFVPLIAPWRDKTIKRSQSYWQVAVTKHACGDQTCGILVVITILCQNMLYELLRNVPS